MSRNRIIYQGETLYVGTNQSTSTQYYTGTTLSTTGAFNIWQLHRIQGANCGYSLTRKDINQFGELASIDRVFLDSPSVNLSFSYLSYSMFNEVAMGFSLSQQRSCLSNFITGYSSNYWIQVVPEGQDAVAYSGVAQYIGIGNGVVSSYRCEASVGNFPTVSVDVDALNLSVQNSLGTPQQLINPTFKYDLGFTFQRGSGQVVYTPAVNPADGSNITGYAAIPTASSHPQNRSSIDSFNDPATVSVLRPGDITFSLVNAGTSTTMTPMGPSIDDAKIQSFNLGVNLNRELQQKLGSKFAFSREIQFPVVASLSIDAIVGDLTSGNLSDMVTANQSYDLTVKMTNPTVSGAGYITSNVEYYLRGAKLDSQNFNSSIGPNAAVTLNFSAQIGGTSQTGVGLFMDGLWKP